MEIKLVLLMGVAVMALPFVISYLLTYRDEEKINIDLSFEKNPRYFGISFRKKISPLLNTVNTEKGIVRGKLSKDEKIWVGKLGKLTQDIYQKHILVFTEDTSIKGGSFLSKEIYGLKDLEIGEGAVVRAVACDGFCRLGREVEVIRWIDSIKGIKAGEGCVIGVVASSKGNISLGKECVFTRLYGFPVETYGVSEFEVVGEELGPVRAERVDISGEKPVLIEGDIFGEKLVYLKNVHVTGTVFCFGDVYLENAVIGNAGKTVSVIGAKVRLGSNVKVYGYIQADVKRGVVV
ncbi:hypothetical protein [Persephonella sp.]